MNQTDVREPLTVGRFPGRWAWFPVGLLGLLISVQAVLFRLSAGDESFAIEPEYYQKAVAWDARARAVQASERLGWQAQCSILQAAGASTLRTTLQDDSGKALTHASVSVEAFPNARATQVQRLTLSEVAPGVYEGAVKVSHGGVWEVRVSASTTSNVFVKTLRTTPSALSN